MDIDHTTIKAVSAKTRQKMLKSLRARKKMPSELSREIGLAPSTVVEHLKNLESAGLIKRVETGHKWVYYELTEKGTGIVQPQIPLKFALTLGIGVLLSVFGFLKSMSSGDIFASIEKSAAPEALRTTAQQAGQIADAGSKAAQSMPAGWIYVLIAAAGLVLAAYSIYKLWKRSA